MLQVDEETTQKKLKDIDHLDLALPKVPMKALYKLQVSVAQEIQLRARADATNLQLAKKVSDTLKITINQVQVERDEVKQCTGRIEKWVEEVFKTIPENAEGGNIPMKEKIEKITQAMENYRSHITELMTPKTKHSTRRSEQKGNRRPQVIQRTLCR
jgi:hypothetical protein